MSRKKSSRWLLIVSVIIGVLILLSLMAILKSKRSNALDEAHSYDISKNVMTTQYEVGNPDPIQTIWISRSLEIQLFETNGAFALYDLKNRIRKIKADPDSAVQETKIDRTTAQSIAKTMEIPWGQLPFNNTSELPDGAVWEKVQLKEGALSSEQTENYDLFWSKKTMGGNFNIDYRQRYHIDSKTKHPFKIEYWQKRGVST